MSFKANSAQQISLFDSFSQLTSREQKMLENSWAKLFADEVFPKIDEKPFAVLYSSKASRPNTPVNVLIGAEIIKQLFDMSDDELVESLMFDIRLQYALHTTSFPEQPLSDKSLSRFRRRVYDYEKENGVDLLKSAVTGLSGAFAKLMDLDGRIRRMDSMMISSNMRKLARSELIYTVIARLLKYVYAKDSSLIPDSLLHYVKENDFNDVFYHQRTSTLEGKLNILLADAISVKALTAEGYEDVPEYKAFKRCFDEQTLTENGETRLIKKEDKLGTSTMLLNPTDPEATFRKKAGKEHQGYVANLEETVGSNGSIVTDYDYQSNNYSDIQFIKDRLAEMPVMPEGTIMVADGAYYSQEVLELAASKNITLVPTALAIKNNRRDVSGFVLNKDASKVIMCPAGHEPKACCYKKNNDEFKISFDRELCANCPHKDQCHAKIYKKVAKVLITKKSLIRKELEKRMQADDFSNYTRLRNGIETVPSNIRRNYSLDKLPRGRQHGKYFFGAIIAALNVRKLLNFFKGSGNYAPNPLLG